MKKTLFLLISLVVLLTACSTSEEKTPKEETSNKKNSNKVEQIATDKAVQGEDYRTILPFKESQARGLIQENMANGYNGDDFEDGLLELSKTVFPTDKFLYQDGQYLNKKTINAYLAPKYTKDELDKMDDDEKKEKKANENLGLNPSHKGETNPKKIAEKSPSYLSNILEQDYYDNGDTDGKHIQGMTIGLAMNSVYYHQKEKNGETYSKKLDTKKVKEEGKRMANELLSRLRENSDLKDIPIHFAIYIQSGNDDITPGHFVANVTAEEGKTRLSDWKDIDEQTEVIPSQEVEDLAEGLNNNFKQFNDNLQSYFSTFTQAAGKVKFVNKKPTYLSVDLPIDYYGKAELVGITQYVTQLSEKYFDRVDQYEIHIKDGNNSRALIQKSRDDKEPQVHIYKN